MYKKYMLYGGFNMRYKCYACGRIYDKEPQYCQCGSYQFKAIANEILQPPKRPSK